MPARLGAFVLAVWYAWRRRDFVDNFTGFAPSFGDAIGLGAIAVGVGGVVAMVGGLVTLTTRGP